jgi:hypothetical protein
MSNQMQSEIASITGEVEDLEDPREAYALVQDRIRRYRLDGSRVPDELAQMERRLMRECMAQSQGR